MSRKARLARGAALAALCAGLGWYFLRPKPPVAEPEDAAVAPAKTANLPDQQAQPLAAENSSSSGLAPGFSPAGGEVEERITVMKSPSRVLVRAPDEKSAPQRRLTEDPGPEINTAVVAPVHGPDAEITPLNVRDPSSLVMPPSNDSINGGDTPPPPKTRKKRAAR